MSFIPDVMFKVEGYPAPQGSKVPGQRNDGRLFVREQTSKTLKPWRKAVTEAARQAAAEWQDKHAPNEPLPVIPFGEHVPVGLSVTFYFERPKSHLGSGRNRRIVKPSAPRRPSLRSTGDLSKLVRAVEDAITDAGVWADDAQVVTLNAKAEYAPHGTPPYAYVTVWETL